MLAVMCGIFSAGMSFAMNAAKPMHEAAAALGVDPLYVALPSYVVIMGGGAIINLGFCFIRLAKVKDLSLKADFSLAKSLIIHNVLLSTLGGLMWYLQFFFYAWGHARIPAQYDYISWMLHMSFYVLCGGIVGLVLKEWNNAGRRPVTVLSLGCVVIIVAANIVGIGMAHTQLDNGEIAVAQIETGSSLVLAIVAQTRLDDAHEVERHCHSAEEGYGVAVGKGLALVVLRLQRQGHQQKHEANCQDS